MVGITNAELESKLKTAMADQKKFQEEIKDELKGRETKIKNEFEKMRKESDHFRDQMLDRADATDKSLAQILQQLSVLTSAQTFGKPDDNNGFRPTGAEKPDLFPEAKGNQKATSLTSDLSSQQYSSKLKPKVSGEFPATNRSSNNNTVKAKQEETRQFYDAPPKPGTNKLLSDGTINLYQPARSVTTGLTDQEIRVKRYFPDFFTKKEADNPDGPLREASQRNRAVFPYEWKLCFANEDVLRKLYLMQVCMVQSMLPYSAWPMRVASEMDEDFITARRAIGNGSLDWAGAVECILKILFNNNALGSPLTTLAKLNALPNETALDFARRLRKAFFNLPSDVLSGPQARDILNHQIRQFLPRTWTTISHMASSLSNEEMGDYVVQVTNSIARWPTEDATFRPIPVNENQAVSFPGQHSHLNLPTTSPPTIADPRLTSTNVFPASQPEDQNGEFVTNTQHGVCFKCGKPGHWSNNCHSSPAAKPINIPANIRKPFTRSRFSNDLRKKYSALKRKGFKRLGSNQKSFLVEPMLPDDDEKKGPADMLEDDNVDQELEDLLEQVLAEEQENFD
ncbi:hypothetical protein K3495_g14884 [Podosphaera aphanis]|nr:hypothetical protein K3495_g14884 [Podosphaera aphanis]